MDNGWIRLPRSIRDSAFWPKTRRRTPLEALLDLRLTANFKPSKAAVGNRVIVIPAHGFLTSQTELAKRWRWDRKTVHKFLLSLNTSKIILFETVRGVDKGYTIITFLNPNGLEPDGDDEIPIEEEKNLPIGSPSAPHIIRREEEESIREVQISMPTQEQEEPSEHGPEPVRSETEEPLSEFEQRLAEFEQAAREGDYWALSTGPAESKHLMTMEPDRLLAVARVKAVFGKPSRVVELRPAEHNGVANASQKRP